MLPEVKMYHKATLIKVIALEHKKSVDQRMRGMRTNPDPHR